MTTTSTMAHRKTRFHQQQQTRLEAQRSTHIQLTWLRRRLSLRPNQAGVTQPASARLLSACSLVEPVCFDNLTLLIESHDGDNSNLCTSCPGLVGLLLRAIRKASAKYL